MGVKTNFASLTFEMKIGRMKNESEKMCGSYQKNFHTKLKMKMECKCGEKKKNFPILPSSSPIRGVYIPEMQFANYYTQTFETMESFRCTRIIFFIAFKL